MVWCAVMGRAVLVPIEEFDEAAQRTIREESTMTPTWGSRIELTQTTSREVWRLYD